MSKKPQLLKSTIWNYARILIRMGLGVLLFRFYCTKLDMETFGLWAFLWSVFGCGVLLDFGFGLAVQKNVAQHAARNEWQPLNHVVSNAMALFCLIGILVLSIGWLMSGPILSMVGSSSENTTFKVALICFFIGMGLSIPMALFQEVMKGLQEIPAMNMILLAATLVNFAVQSWLLMTDGGIILLVVSSSLVIIVQYVVAAIYCFRRYPELKLSIKCLSLQTIIETGRFSLCGYFIILSYMVITKTDQLILGSMAGLAAVAIYQPALKLGELFGVLTRQLSENLQPAAAHYSAQGQQDRIRGLILTGLRWSGLLAAPMFFVCVIEVENILSIITGLEKLEITTIYAATILLVWAFSFVMTHNVLKRVMVMTGKEKSLVKIGIQEAVLNVGLSILFVKLFGGPVGVALGTLVASVLFGWGALWKWACNEVQLSSKNLFETNVLPGLLCPLPGATIALLTQVVFGSHWASDILQVAINGTIIGCSTLVLWWFYALSENEKELLSAKLGRFKASKSFPTKATTQI